MREREWHGKTKTTEYVVWKQMRNRILNPTATGFQYYGGKGISMDPRWRDSFLAFYQDMGDRPKGTSLDRIDPDGDYCKENCRWATNIKQGQNKTSNVFLTYAGRTQTMSAWARELEIKPNTLVYRIKRGWSVERALTAGGKCG